MKMFAEREAHGIDGEFISFQIIQIIAIEFMTECGKLLQLSYSGTEFNKNHAMQFQSIQLTQMLTEQQPPEQEDISE